MKGLLNSVSMPNWMNCIDQALRKSGMTRKDIGYLDILHIKRSGHDGMLKELGLTEEQTIYLENYGHVGQIDQILSLKLALEEGEGEGWYSSDYDCRRYRLYMGSKYH